MASSVLLLHLIVAFSAISAAYARPCKTIFFYYTTTTITSQNYSSNTFFFTSLITTRNDDSVTKAAVFSSFTSYPFPRSIIDQQLVDQKNRAKKRRNRTSVILSALLFGVGCGAVTAATTYLVWSLICPFGSDEEEDKDECNDELNNPKYATLPDDDEIDAIKKAAQAQAKDC